jgi:pimeloyl-ACP methyl ester carboxylesterase
MPRLQGEVVEINTTAGTSLVTAKLQQGNYAVVYFGGNAEDVSLSIPKLAAAFPDHAIYALHYRGFSGSDGAPTEAALFSDAVALFDLASQTHRRIRVVGGSLGSGVAVFVASVRPAAQLVLATPYDSLVNVLSDKLPLLPVRILLRDKFESWRYAPKVKAPTLVLIADHDEVIPRARTDALLSHFRSGIAKTHVVLEATHNSIYEKPEYVSLIRNSLQ